MRRLLAVGALTWSSMLGAQTPTTPPAPMIFTTGTGEVEVTPDRATILLAVETRNQTAAGAGQDNSRNQRHVIDALRKLGIASDEISTFGYNVYPEQRNDGKQTRVIAYVARNTIRVELKRIDLAGPAIDAALGNGANVVSSLRFYSSRFDEVRRQALAAAVVQARIDAEAMAKAAGGMLGGLSELSSNYSGPRPFEESATMMTRATAAAAPEQTPIEPGQQTVRVTVNARWSFLQNR